MSEATHVTRIITRGAREVRVVRRCALEVVRGVDRGRSVEIAQLVFRVGAHAANDLALRDDTISNEHVEVALLPEGYRVTDLSSSNGTFVGRMRLGQLTVVDPIVLELGNTSLRLNPTDTESEIPASESTRFGALLGRSVAMRELFEQLERVAGSDCSILLEGETGTGKELVAESIHAQSARRDRPFVVIDCGAMPANLLESELFGHVRGAFTGADADRPGLFAQANGGTVFLDEIGELPLALQSKLLGVVERRKVTPAGASQGFAIDIRIIAATNRNLAAEINSGGFRSDLFYRLAVVRLRIPPLRERRDDIPLLVTSMLNELRLREGDLVPSTLSAIAIAKLAAQPWPGNVRELRNAVERVALRIDAHAGATSTAEPFALARERTLAEFERRYVLELLEQCDLNVSEAARRAAMDRRNFQRLVRRHRIDPRKLR